VTLFDFFRSIKTVLGLATGRSKMASRSDTGCLVVGMEKSRKYGACPGAGVDGDRMAEALEDYGDVIHLSNSEAQGCTFKSALQQVCRKELAIVYYAGHGGRSKSGSSESGYSEHLCLDDGPFWDHEIWKTVSCAAGRVVLIFDCCHSGHMYRHAGFEGEWTGVKYLHADELEPLYPGFEFSLLRTRAIAAGEHDILVWSGCPAESYSYGDASGGVFTNGILKGASSVFATYDSVWKSAKRAAESQKPVRTVIGTGFDGLVFR
jgi:hypothetical protein